MNCLELLPIALGEVRYKCIKINKYSVMTIMCNWKLVNLRSFSKQQK